MSASDQTIDEVRASIRRAIVDAIANIDDDGNTETAIVVNRAGWATTANPNDVYVSRDRDNTDPDDTVGSWNFDAMNLGGDNDTAIDDNDIDEAEEGLVEAWETAQE